jgi:hypothetical protein
LGTIRIPSDPRLGPLGTYARHYYDLFQLASQAEVIAMLKSGEYAAIKKDYDAISREYFPGSYFYPVGMSFAKSDALFPQADLAKAIGAEYEAQCKLPLAIPRRLVQGWSSSRSSSHWQN